MMERMHAGEGGGERRVGGCQKRTPRSQATWPAQHCPERLPEAAKPCRTARCCWVLGGTCQSLGRLPGSKLGAACPGQSLGSLDTGCSTPLASRQAEGMRSSASGVERQWEGTVL